MSSSRDIANIAAIVGGLTGELKMWPNAVAPAGYLICDGSIVSRTTYASLFATIGTAFGAGNGTTTFNLPDYRDRMPIGAGNLYSASNTGGNKDMVVPSHSHAVTDSGHSHSVTDTGHSHGIAYSGVLGFSGGGGYGGTAFGGAVNQGTQAAGTGISVVGAATGIAVNTTGVSANNANLPPYMGIHFIIRYI